MYLEIVSPEATLFQGEIDALSVPGTQGSFQVLNNHAAVVSTLAKGEAKIQGKLGISDAFKSHFNQKGNETFLTLSNGGTLEMSDNKVILLVD
jgi:F-type H+-transporting ATPase subunit epsilon